MSDSAFTIVSSPKSIHMAGASIMLAMSGQKIQGAEFINAKSSTVLGAFVIESSNSAIFHPKMRIFGFFPGLGVSPPDFVLPQNLPQPFYGYSRYDPLFNKVLPQLWQRPYAHADQFFRRGKRNLADLLNNIGKKPTRSSPTTIVRIPDYRIYAPIVETVDNPPHPCRRAAASLGNYDVFKATTGQQNNSCVSAIDSVDQLLFHPPKLAAFPRPELPCYNFRHFGFSTNSQPHHAVVVENLCILHIVGAQALYLQVIKKTSATAKLSNWKRH